MEKPGFAHEAKRPGFDTLAAARHEQYDGAINHDEVQPFLYHKAHRSYLENNAFHRYLKMHKVIPGISGAKELQVLGRELEDEYMPTYVDAAAWAYAEAGMTDTTLSTLERVQLISKAETLWQRAVTTDLHLQTSEYGEFFNEPTAPYRYALPLVFSPLMKSVIVGNVKTSLLQQSLADTVTLASGVSDELQRRTGEENVYVRGTFLGLAHELNALSTLLYLEDPRYIPMPSTARADTGYYHREQTHDIMVLNQHWGTVRKVVPIEVKAKESGRDRRRYKSLIIRGKMHLATDGANPTETIQSFQRLLDGTAQTKDVTDVERIATDVREMLRRYQQGVTVESIAVNSLTKFRQPVK